jgi:hypothetical protein
VHAKPLKVYHGKWSILALATRTLSVVERGRQEQGDVPNPFTGCEALDACLETRIDDVFLRSDAFFLVVGCEEREHDMRAFEDARQFVGVGVAGFCVRDAGVDGGGRVLEVVSELWAARRGKELEGSVIRTRRVRIRISCFLVATRASMISEATYLDTLVLVSVSGHVLEEDKMIGVGWRTAGAACNSDLDHLR